MIVYIYGNHQAEIEKMLEEYRNIIFEYKKKLETQREERLKIKNETVKETSEKKSIFNCFVKEEPKNTLSDLTRMELRALILETAEKNYQYYACKFSYYIASNLA